MLCFAKTASLLRNALRFGTPSSVMLTSFCQRSLHYAQAQWGLCPTKISVGLTVVTAPRAPKPLRS